MSSQQDLSQCLHFRDITSQLNDIILEMKDDEMLQAPQFSLYESMSATELCDPKMDWKCNLISADTYNKGLETKKIKQPNELTKEELIWIFDEVLTREMQWFQGSSLAQTLFTFVYLYEPSFFIPSASPLSQLSSLCMQAFVQALSVGGFYCMDLIRRSNYLRDDDYVPSVVSFGKLELSDQEVVEKLLECERQVIPEVSSKSKSKKQKKNQSYDINDALDARLKLRRELFSLYCLTRQKFSAKLAEEINRLIKTLRNQIQIIRATSNLGIESYSFSDTINKTILAHIPPRPLKFHPLQKTFDYFERMLSNLEKTIDLSEKREFYEIINILEDDLSVGSKEEEIGGIAWMGGLCRNVFCSAFLDVSLFCIPEKYFGGVDFKDILLDNFKNFGVNLKNIGEHKAFQEFLPKGVLVGLEFIAKYMRNKFRQQRDFSKLYQDLSVLIHEANQTDEVLSPNKKEGNMLLIWCYDMAIKMMIKQLLLGFEMDLYIDCDYPFVLFYLDYLCGALDNNNRSFVSRFDKKFLQAWQTKINLSKKMKKLTDFERRFFFESIYYKGLQFYFKALSRFSFFLYKKGFIKIFNNDETFETRFNHRFRIFEKCYFIKKLDFEAASKILSEFTNSNEEPSKNFEKLRELFSEAQKLFTMIEGEESFGNKKIKENCGKLKRLCILNNFAMSKYEKVKNNVDVKATFKKNEHDIFHYIDF